MPADKETTFKVIMRGSRFTLTRSQIEFDSPNYFTMCFLGEFNEAKTRAVEIFRNPSLFPYIVDYLCGYNVLPLDRHSLGAGVSEEKVVRNLRADAEFYQLDGLIEACDEYLARNPSKQYILIGGTFVYAPDTPISERTGLLRRKENFKTHISHAQAVEEFIPILSESPGQCKSFADFSMLGAVEKFAESMLNPVLEPLSAVKLIGWRTKYDGTTRMELLILMEMPKKK